MVLSRFARSWPDKVAWMTRSAMTRVGHIFGSKGSSSKDQQFARYLVGGTAVRANTSTSRLLGRLMLRTTLFVSILKE